MPAQLSSILAKDQPWQTAYPALAILVTAELAKEPRRVFGTTELMKRLQPDCNPKNAEHKGLRTRLIRALRALAKHDLAHCVTLGEIQPVGLYKKPGRPMRWQYQAPEINPYDL